MIQLKKGRLFYHIKDKYTLEIKKVNLQTIEFHTTEKGVLTETIDLKTFLDELDQGIYMIQTNY